MNLKLVYLVLFALVLSSGVAANAQTTITGQLKDDATGPLVGAKVSIFGTSVSTLTDAKGYYSLPVTSYPVKLEISYQGYITTAVFQGKNKNANTPQIPAPAANIARSEIETVNSTLMPRRSGSAVVHNNQRPSTTTQSTTSSSRLRRIIDNDRQSEARSKTKGAGQ